jgi:hypothetical protein
VTQSQQKQGLNLATPAQKRSVLETFNQAAARYADWRAQKRHGPHETRRTEMLARVATFPGGAELLQQAAAKGVEIVVVREAVLKGGAADWNNNGPHPVIRVGNCGDPAGMALAFWHELRHMRQDDANPGRGFANGGQVRDASTAHLMGMMIEADAFTAETLLALQQKKAGNPEYYAAMFRAHDANGVHGEIVRFLEQKPYESFPGDAAFARGLFTYLMTEGLQTYRTGYFNTLAGHFRRAPTLGDFQALLARAERGGMRANQELTDMYGPGFSGVAPRALATAFWPAQNYEERGALDLIVKTISRAPSLTETGFQKARDEILDRAMGISFRELEHPRHVPDEEQQARDRLTKAAAQDRMPPRRPRPSA